jgi:hypothetical protein
VLIAIATTVVVAAAVQSADVVVDGRMHHLRSGQAREWASFPATAEGPALIVTFNATANDSERTLRLRHRGLKQAWRVLVNGREVARLPPDENDMITYWSVPAGMVKDGPNELRVAGPTGGVSDDVMVGEIALLDRSRAAALAEGRLSVSVTDEVSGQQLPSRVTLTDERGVLISSGNASDRHSAVRPGVVYASTGRAEIALPAGRYVVYAGRGFEYGIASARVTITAGGTTTRALAIRREVDTSGWAAMDTHIHTFTHSRHGDAAIEEQMHAIAGEGIELPVSTEHNLRIDFDQPAVTAGVRHLFTPLVGSEVTTAAGHFNVWPLPATGPAIDQRAPDWNALAASIAAAASDPVVILNHGRDLHGKFRPLDPVHHVSLTGERLDGATLPANAMEVVNSGAVQTDALGLVEDWMGLLNRGLPVVPVGASDSHDVARSFVGQGRTYVAAADGDPGRIDLNEVRANVRRGRVMVSYGLLTEARVAEAGPGEVARPRTGDLRIQVRVQGPAWTRADRLAVFANGVLVRTERVSDTGTAGTKWSGEVRLGRPKGDVIVVAVATGPGVTMPYWPTARPYQPTSIDFTPYVLGVSGAVFVDVDGSGRFESAFAQAERLVTGVVDLADLSRRLSGYDRAVASQAASLLRARDPARFRTTVQTLLETATPDVAAGLRQYLQVAPAEPELGANLK